MAPLTLMSTRFLATLPAAQQDFAPVWVALLQDVFASAEHADFSLAHSPACKETMVAKAATVKQTRSFFI